MTRGGPNDGLRLSSRLSILSSLICSLSGLVRTSSITVSPRRPAATGNGGHRDCSCLATEMERPPPVALRSAATAAAASGEGGPLAGRPETARLGLETARLPPQPRPRWSHPAAVVPNYIAGAGLNRRSVVSASRAERQYVLSTDRTAAARPNGANGRRPNLRLAGGAWVGHPADLAVGGDKPALAVFDQPERAPLVW